MDVSNSDEKRLNDQRSLAKIAITVEHKEELKIPYKELIPQLVASSSIYLLVVQAGINMAFSSVLITQLNNNNDIVMSESSASNIAALMTICVPVGSLCSGYIMDLIGRKRAAFYICFPFILSWILISCAQNLYMLYISRVISGITVGLTTICLVYVSEIAHKDFRSVLLCLNSVWVSFGIFVTYLLNFLGLQWRSISLTFTIFSIITTIVIFLLAPESPHWLIALNKNKSEEGNADEAKKSFSQLYHNNQIAVYQFEELIQINIAKQSNQSPQLVSNHKDNWNDKIMEHVGMFRQPQVYKPLIILFILFLLQQLTGGYVLIFYTINLFRNLGPVFSAKVNINAATLMVGTIRLVMAIIAAILSQKYCKKRKTLMYVSSLGMAVFALIVAIKMFQYDGMNNVFLAPTNQPELIATVSNSSSNEYVMLLCILGYVCFGSVGVLIIPWTLIGELFPIKVKGKLAGLTISLAYVLMFIVLKLFPYALQILTTPGIFLLFSINSFLCCLFVFIFLPETHGKTFSSIENYFIAK
ncbi:unnamed protein product [Diamesa serratosioi]